MDHVSKAAKEKGGAERHRCLIAVIVDMLFHMSLYVI